MVGIFFILLGLVLLGFELLAVFRIELLWKWTVFDNNLKGRKSEYNDAWEIKTFLGGIILGGLGLCFLFWA